MRRRWKAAAGAIALAVAAALGGVSPAVSRAEPAAAVEGFLEAGDRHSGIRPQPRRHDARDSASSGADGSDRRAVLPAVADHRDRRQPAERQDRSRADAQHAARCSAFPANRIIVEDKANSTVQNAQFSVPLAKQAGTSGIILVTSTTHQGRADGDFADAGGNLLATVSYPDGNPTRQRRPVRARRDQPVRQRRLAHVRSSARLALASYRMRRTPLTDPGSRASARSCGP